MLISLIILAYLVAVAPLVVNCIRGLVYIDDRDGDRRVSTRAWVITIFFWLGVWIPITVFLFVMSIYVDVLWFRDLGQSDRYWTTFWTKNWLFWGVGFAALFGIVAGGVVNYRLARRSTLHKDAPFFMVFTTIIFAALAALLFGVWARLSWETVLVYFNSVSIGETDPVFNKDIGFYLFELPFLKMAAQMLFVFFLLQIAQSAVYLLIASVDSFKDKWGVEKTDFTKQQFSTAVRAFLSPLFVGFAFLFAVLAYLFYLGPYGYLNSNWGAVYGITHVDGLRMTMNTFMVGVLAVSAVVLLLGAFISSHKLRLWLSGGTVSALIVGQVMLLWALPVIVQSVKVSPNEFTLEEQNIVRNIEFTRHAYGLDMIEELTFDPGLDEVNLSAIMAEEDTLNNIRLADWRALQDTFQQRQVFRRYYEFPDIDIDRYWIDGKYRQVMFSPRELNQDLLDPRAQRWVNQRLKFTHGYGVVMVQVNDFHDGLPRFLVKDIPPKSSVDDIQITRPEIYFGERTDVSVIINSTVDEFSYPQGDQNVTTRYEAASGVELGDKFSPRRIALALSFDGIKFFTSKHLNSDSRILYRRNIEDRVYSLAPFLMYDADPYLVIDSGGRLLWMWDAYTTSDKYPYSTPINGYNYIRNSVKIVIDAYTGEVTFYVFDEEDPVLRVWRNIFPGLFTPRDQMPEDLVAHIRYPEQLLIAQGTIYSVYHMTDPEVFYNREDPWTFAQEKYRAATQNVEPYYIIMRLPGEETQEFILMMPFTPLGAEGEGRQRNNMVGWMAGRSDGEHYGKLLAYKFPKDKLTPGPLQIESFIDSDPDISKVLTLWDQRGSSVIRGNLLVIPIGGTLLYVEPVYLQAETSPIPRLERVVVGIGEKIAWGDDLNDALRTLFRKMDGVYVPSSSSGGSTASDDTSLSDDVATLVAQANSYYQNYLNLTGEGRVIEAAQELANLQDVLRRLEFLIEDAPAPSEQP